MPWKVDASEYRSAVNLGKQDRPALLNQGPATVRKNTASVPKATVATPNVRQAVGTAMDTATSSVQQAAASMVAPAKGQTPKGFSAAGVPLYPTSTSTPQPIAAPRAPRVATAPQGSGTRSAIGSGIAPGPVFPAPPVISPNSERILAPSGAYENNVAPSSVLTQGLASAQGPVLPNTPIVSDPGLIPAPAGSGSTCNTCQTGGAAGCESCGGCNCGPDGCFDASEIASRAGLYGSVGEARYYGHLEALLYTRDNGNISLSTIGSVGSFDFDAGWRATFGERFDAINGRELSYFGTADISDSSTFTGNISPTFASTDLGNAIQPFGFTFPGRPATSPTPGTPAETVDGVIIPATPASPGQTALAPADIFASTQSQFTETTIHSLEFNRVRWAWDVFKSFVGIRYIYVDDRYQLDSFNPGLAVDPNGSFQLYAQNNLIGPNIGGEWFYDVGYRLSLSTGLKGGIYANFNELDTRLIRGTTAALNNEDENTSFATSVDWNLIAHYQISPRGRFRFGYNVTYLNDIATVSDNQPSVPSIFGPVVVNNPATITAATGTNATDNGDATFHGLSFGLEFFR